jgi:hypothetical protein
VFLGMISMQFAPYVPKNLLQMPIAIKKLDEFNRYKQEMFRVVRDICCRIQAPININKDINRCKK